MPTGRLSAGDRQSIRRDASCAPTDDGPWQGAVSSARDLLVAKGLAKDAADADARLGGVRAANLKRLEQEEALTAAEIDLNQVELPLFQFGKDDYRAIHQFMVTWHCLTMSWIADLYHFAYWDASPLLPTLLPGLLHPGFPPDVARALIDHYCLSYRVNRGRTTITFATCQAV